MTKETRTSRPKAKYELTDWQYITVINALHNRVPQLRKVETDTEERPAARASAEVERQEVEDTIKSLRDQGEPA